MRRFYAATLFCILALPTLGHARAIIEDCTQGVSFDNGNTYKNVTGTIQCHLRQQPHIKTRIVPLKDGKKHGKATFYDGVLSRVRNPQNRVVRVEHYQNDKPHGKHLRYNAEDGKLENEKDFVNGILQREVSVSPFDGSKSISFHKKHEVGNWGEKIGSLSYTTQGKLSDKRCPKQASGVKELDSVCGFGGGSTTTKLYDEQGRVTATTTQSQGKTNERKEFYPSGKLRVVRTPNTQRFYYENGKLEEEVVDNANRTQTVTEYYESGTKKSFVHTVHRKLQESSRWYMNGKPEYTVKRQGNSEQMRVKSWHGNGKVFEEYTYIPKDRYSMFFRSFYRSGQLIGHSRVYFKNGQLADDVQRNPQGKLQSAKYYYESGQLRKRIQMHTDQSRTVEIFNKDGSVKESGTYYPDGSLKE